MTRISAVIPCYNQGSFLSECISSILNQTSEVDEIIVVNDGSTDLETINLLKKLNFPRTRIITQKNLGLPAARNTGFREAAGSWVLVIDADDYFAPTFLQNALDEVASDDSIGAVSCWVQMFGNQNDLWKCTGGTVEDFAVRNKCSSAGLVQRKLWASLRGYDEQMVSYEDWDFWLRLTSLGYRVHVIPMPLFYYRKHSVSLLATNYDNHFEIRSYIIRKNKEIYDRRYPDIILELERDIVQFKLQRRQSASRSFWLKLKNKLFQLIKPSGQDLNLKDIH